MEFPETLHVDFEDDRTVVLRRAAGATEFEVVEVFPRRLTPEEVTEFLIALHVSKTDEPLTVDDVVGDAS